MPEPTEVVIKEEIIVETVQVEEAITLVETVVVEIPAATAAPPSERAPDAMFFEDYGVNPFIDTDDDHLSTFAIDVDTGSYTIARRCIEDGHLPPEDAVRVEEFVNYFDQRYAYPPEG